jgi:Mn2+/Fe2+ NRAMP family transporter
MSLPTEHDTLPPSQDPAVASGVIDPPQSFWGILRKIGPGLIIAGSIVGSGELIMTTKTGAQAGISLLWLIIIGSMIKVFVQIELGRYAITHGESTLVALNRVPCPRVRVNFIIWFWLAMMITGIAQLGGIVGGVGQSLALTVPITGDYLDAVKVPSRKEIEHYLKWSDVLVSSWDAERYAKWQSGGESPLSTGGLTDAERDWTQKHLEFKQGKLRLLEIRGIEHIDEINQAALQDFEAALQDFDPASLTDSMGDDRLILLQEMPEEARRRLVRGHEILGSQLKELDKDNLRATKAVMAVDQKQDNVKELIDPSTLDDKYWAAAVTLMTMALLFRGRYGLIQNLSMVLVVMFTFITVGNVFALQSTEAYHISPDQFLRGLSFGLPQAIGNVDPLVTALFAFGIIGVGASELITYPYWCLEKGYAKFTGKRTSDDAWANRARGWMRVMHFDAFLSMVVYTVATLAFYLVGVAVLYSEGRDPEGMRMVSTLATAYVPIFGDYARWLFLIGAFAVLYSTFLIATAGNARMWTDGCKLFGFIDPHNERTHVRTVTAFSMVIPVICLGTFWSGLNPVAAISTAGFMQATLLPMIGFGALYLRHTRTDPRLKPSKAWDAALVISCIGLLMAGGWGAFEQIRKLLDAYTLI